MTKKQPIHPRAPGFSGRKALFPILGAAVLVLAALALGLLARPAPFPRLEIAGFRITREEYLRAMYQARSEVLAEHAAAGISLTDWSTGTALGDPCRLTAERATELLQESYAVSTLAVERGYLSDASFEALQQELEQLNQQRREALDSGAIVTGLPTFTMEDYLCYRASHLKLRFCNDPGNPENQVSAEDIQSRYASDRDKLYRQPDSVELAFLLAEGEEAEAQEEAFRQARELGSLAAALEELPQLRAYYREISVHPGNYAAYARSHADILAFAADLQSGELSQVIALEGWLCLVECRQRTAHNYVPLEEVRSVVVQSIRESRYDALIARRMADMAVDTDWKALIRFTADQLR